MSVDLIQMQASDDMVAKAARVSTLGANDSKATQGFIDFLWREQHGSPFEHNMFTFLVECPIFVSRELVRHRIASYNETSGRYRELEGVFYIPPKTRKLQQVGKTGDYNFEDGTPDQHAAVEVEYVNACEQAWHSYRTMLDAGVAKEVARGVLPTTLYTSLYVTMNARGLINFLNLRLDHHAQAEIREVAEKMAWYLQASCPMTYAAWQKYK